MSDRSIANPLKAFNECLRRAQNGKTFSFFHRDFVAMDHQTYAELREQSRPLIAHVDEAQVLTDEHLAALDSMLRLGRNS